MPKKPKPLLSTGEARRRPVAIDSSQFDGRVKLQLYYCGVVCADTPDVSVPYINMYDIKYITFPRVAVRDFCNVIVTNCKMNERIIVFYQ